MIYKTKRCKLYFHYNHGQGHMLLLVIESLFDLDQLQHNLIY